jgi:FKBP-type peptidyl-prolyl cis-trans isomerase
MNIAKSFLAAAAICAAGNMAAQTAEPDSLTLAVATSMSKSIEQSLDNMSSIGIDVNKQAFAKALFMALNGENTGFTPQSAEQFIDQYMRKVNGVMPATVSVESQQAYLDKMAQTPGAKRLDSGVIFITIKEGTGAYPTDADKVSVECYAILSDGSVFYETEEGKPDDYDVTGVIKGFAEGLKLMRLGGKYRVIIPSELAYGERGINGVVPGNAALDFTVTLDAIQPKDSSTAN